MLDIPTVLFAMANVAIVVYAFDRLGAMIPESSWGGLFVNVERIWSWRQAGRSVESPAPFGYVRSDPPDDTPTDDSWDEPVAVIEEISGSRSTWRW